MFRCLSPAPTPLPLSLPLSLCEGGTSAVVSHPLSSGDDGNRLGGVPGPVCAHGGQGLPFRVRRGLHVLGLPALLRASVSRG